MVDEGFKNTENKNKNTLIAQRKKRLVLLMREGKRQSRRLHQQEEKGLHLRQREVVFSQGGK